MVTLCSKQSNMKNCFLLSIECKPVQLAWGTTFWPYRYHYCKEDNLHFITVYDDGWKVDCGVRNVWSKTTRKRKPTLTAESLLLGFFSIGPFRKKSSATLNHWQCIVLWTNAAPSHVDENKTMVYCTLKISYNATDDKNVSVR